MAWRWTGLLLTGVLVLAPWSAPAAVGEEAPEEIPLLPGSDPDKPLPDGEALDAGALKATDKDKKRMLEKAEHSLAVARGGGGGEVTEFDNPVAIRVSLVPEAAYVFNRGSFEFLTQIHAANPAGIAVHADRCQVISVLLERRKDPTPLMQAAIAYGRLAQVWARSLAGLPVDARRLEASAAFVQKLRGEEATPRKTWLAFVHGTLVGSVAAPGLAPWAEAEVARLQAASASDPAVRRLTIVRSLCGAMRLAATGDRTGPAALSRELAANGESVIPSSDVELTGLYNRAVTLGRKVKASPKPAYRTTEAKTTSGCLVVQVPIGTGWTQRRGDGDQDDGGWVKKERDRTTTIQVWKYKTTVDYVDQEGKVVGGDNLGGRLKKGLEDDKASLHKVKKVVANVGRLSRGVPDSRGYEIRGESGDGTEHWYREWFFKSEIKPAALNVSVRCTGRGLDTDIELEALIDSMSAPEKGR